MPGQRSQYPTSVHHWIVVWYIYKISYTLKHVMLSILLTFFL